LSVIKYFFHAVPQMVRHEMSSGILNVELYYLFPNNIIQHSIFLNSFHV